jgi:hypothetical protein
MPLIDYHLTTTIEISKEDISSGAVGALSKNLELGKDKRTWNQKQLQALTLILCNLVRSWREDGGVFLYSRDKKTIDKKFNPLGIGYSSLFFVIDKLIQAGLLDGKVAPPRTVGNNPKLLSTFIATPKILKFAYELGINTQTVRVLKSPHVRLRDNMRKLQTYTPNTYTKYLEELMSNYCNHLNQQSIMLKTDDKSGEGIVEYGDKLGGLNIHLHRNFKTWTNDIKELPQINNLNSKIPNNNFNLGGRSGGYWHSIKKEDRPTILINGNKTKEADFPCSHINLCYRHETHNWYQQETYKELKEEGREQEDAYIISSVVHRDLTKYMVQLMFNIKGKAQVSKKFNDWIYARNKNEKDNATKQQRQYHSKHNFSNMQLMEMIENKHAKIKDYFYKGKIAGQIIQWEEANLVFNIANQFINEHGITTLTVHDEFIVEEKHYPMVKEFMYSSGYSEVCAKYSLMNRIKHM